MVVTCAALFDGVAVAHDQFPVLLPTDFRSGQDVEACRGSSVDE